MVERDAALRSYVQAKHDVAGLLRETRQLLEQCRAPGAARVQALLARLAEDQFNLTVLGQFKRGKSSLINAVVGQELLPVAAVPLTSVVTALRYGPAPRAVLRRRGFALPQEIPLAEIADYVTERGNPENAKGVLAAEIEAPVPFLRRGLRFIDTPGIGSLHAHNTVSAYATLPESDAAIVVTSAESPLTEAELAFLDTIRQHVRKVFFVLNKADQLDRGERAEVLAFTQAALARRLEVEGVRLFPLSAREALAAKRGNDAARLEASGLPAFESALAEFLSVERGAVFLTALLDRALRLLDGARMALDLTEAAHGQSETQAAERAHALDQQFQAREAARGAIVAEVEAALTAWRAPVFAPALGRFAAETGAALANALERQLAELGELAADDLYLRTRAWLSGWLVERGHAWLAAQAEPLATVANEQFAQAGSRLDELVARLARDAGTAVGLAPPRSASPPDAEDAAGWRPPDFDLERERRRLEAAGSGERQDDLAPMLPLPDGLARRVVRRMLERQARRGVEHLVAALGRGVDAYLALSVHELDLASHAALEAARRQLEAVLQPFGAGADAAQRRIALEALAARLERLRDALLSGTPLPPLAAPLPEPATEVPDGSPSALELASWSLAREAERGGCPLCAAAFAAVHDYLCHEQYELAVNSEARQALRAAGGLCALHTWHLEAVASPRGLSSGYPALLEHVAWRLQAAAALPAASARAQVARLLPSVERCPACEVRRRAEEASARRLAAELLTPAGRAAFERGDGLCLRHLHLMLGLLDDERAALLLRRQARRLTDVSEAMERYVLKLEARRRELLSDDDERAYLAALTLLVGEKRVW
ncbi:MAG TPA: dynamin family protein [Thermomicrobiaceae bacterium]|nr:dynamin family protein [Thermomicrobiaceae bacterium]